MYCILYTADELIISMLQCPPQDKLCMPVLADHWILIIFMLLKYKSYTDIAKNKLTLCTIYI